MTDEKITIEIDEGGEIRIETRGFKGPTCLEEARQLIDRLAIPIKENRTDDFYASGKVGVRRSVLTKGDKS